MTATARGSDPSGPDKGRKVKASLRLWSRRGAGDESSCHSAHKRTPLEWSPPLSDLSGLQVEKGPHVGPASLGE